MSAQGNSHRYGDEAESARMPEIPVTVNMPHPMVVMLHGLCRSAASSVASSNEMMMIAQTMACLEAALEQHQKVTTGDSPAVEGSPARGERSTTEPSSA